MAQITFSKHTTDVHAKEALRPPRDIDTRQDIKVYRDVNSIVISCGKQEIALSDYSAMLLAQSLADYAEEVCDHPRINILDM